MSAKEGNENLEVDKKDDEAKNEAKDEKDDEAGPSTGGPRFEVKKWNAVTLWSWDIAVDNCAICRNNIMDPCIECQASAVNDPEDCSVAWGTCGHAFHSHCIQRWLRTREVCPMDNKPWEYLRIGR